MKYLIVLIFTSCSLLESEPTIQSSLEQQQNGLDSIALDSIENRHNLAKTNIKNSVTINELGWFEGEIHSELPFSLFIIASHSDKMRVEFAEGVYDEHFNFQHVGKILEMEMLKPKVVLDTAFCSGHYGFTLIGYTEFQTNKMDTTEIPLLRDSIFYNYKNQAC
jgi:hypothetical protein